MLDAGCLARLWTLDFCPAYEKLADRNDADGVFRAWLVEEILNSFPAIPAIEKGCFSGEMHGF